MNEPPKKDSVVSFEDMRKELLSRKRLSPTVAARARLSELKERALPGDKIILPFFQAAMVLSYLTANEDEVPGAGPAITELTALLQEVLHRAFWRQKKVPLLVEVTQPTFETFAMLDYFQIVETMKDKFAAELDTLGYEHF